MSVSADINKEQQWPEADTERIRNCPICASGDRYLLYQGLQDRVFFCAPGQWNLHRCKGCGSGYLDPRPTADSIGRAYDNYFIHDTNKPEDYHTLSWPNRIKRRLANGYRNARFGLQLEPASRWGTAAMQLLPGQAGDLEAERRHLPRNPTNGRLLDFGCGNGRFLELACQMNWEAVGMDFDRKSVRTARLQGLDVRQGGVDSLNQTLGEFDGITLSHVIEHMHEPLRLLRACYRLLKPGGWLWLETPNFNSLGHRFFGYCWRDLDPPRHLVLFTPESLRSALKKAGFQHVTELPYRPLCRMIYSASEAIAAGLDPWKNTSLSKKGWYRVITAEFKARFRPAVREFVTIKAWKSN